MGVGRGAASYINHALIETTLPAGRCTLLNVAPPVGTTRGRWPGTPGLSLATSFLASKTGVTAFEAGVQGREARGKRNRPQAFLHDST